MKSKGIGLISGGLDSILAALILREQGIEILGITFTTPFFSAKRGEEAARAADIPLVVIDMTDEHMAMVRNPKYGYGKNMNPCIDCHGLMLKKAGDQMREISADFIFTGEVLGQRPMSQNRQSLHIVAKLSGYADFIVRPLSARLLDETLPEREGKIDRSRLLDIQGRGRKRQLEMARHFGITQYHPPAGGCLLTDPIFSARLRDLFRNQPGFDRRDVVLLKYGRHFRLKGGAKIIVGRNEKENEKILNAALESDRIIRLRDVPGPTVLIPGGSEDDEVIHDAARLCMAYGKIPPGRIATLSVSRGKEVSAAELKPADKSEFQDFLI